MSTAQPAASIRYWTILLLCLVGGFALRLESARTAVAHPDELHAVSDALWSRSSLGPSEVLRFLRTHPRDHLRLDLQTGRLVPWNTPGETARWGHPCLYQYLLGAVFYAVPPTSTNEALLTGRTVNVVADTVTIGVLPTLVVALGGGVGAGLAAAALYAVFPPAATYGAIANHDPLLAPLMVVLLVALARPERKRGHWLAAGVATGLLVSVKQTGLIAFAFVPIVWLCSPGRSFRGLGLWAVAACAVVAAFTDPAAYVASLRHPPAADAGVALRPIADVTGNLRALVDPQSYYWLSFARHGGPLAPFLARLHVLLTPLYVWAWLAAFALTVLRRQWWRLLLLYLPVALVIPALARTDAMWRLEILFPLLCASVALEFAALPRRSWYAIVPAATVIAVLPFLPARVAADGSLDLADLLVMNPQARQPPGFWASWLGRPLAIVFGPDVSVSRHLWVRSGTYRVLVTSSGPASVELDGVRGLEPGAEPTPVSVAGPLCRLVVRFPAGGVLRSLRLVPATSPPDT